MNKALYREEVMDHYQFPRNIGKPLSFSHCWQEVNAHCGDEITVYLTTEKGKIKSIRYEAKGCAISIASASMLSELLVGKTEKEVLSLTGAKLLSLLRMELTPTRLSCAYLPVEAIKKALLKK